MTSARLLGLRVMAGFYVLAGAMHFLRPDVYRPMMPPWLPAHEALILLSGAAEISLGLLLLVPATRQMAAWGIILLLIAVCPANIHIAWNDVPLFGAKQGAGAINWVRLPLQGARRSGSNREGRKPSRHGRRRPHIIFWA
jgi:uncharacterized membrane protein